MLFYRKKNDTPYSTSARQTAVNSPPAIAAAKLLAWEKRNPMKEITRRQSQSQSLSFKKATIYLRNPLY